MSSIKTKPRIPSMCKIGDWTWSESLNLGEQHLPYIKMMAPYEFDYNFEAKEIDAYIIKTWLFKLFRYYQNGVLHYGYKRVE